MTIGEIKMSEMTPDAAISGTERLLALDGTTSKTIAVNLLSGYVIDDLVASAVATPTSGDVLLGARSTDEKTFSLNGISGYAVDYVFANASAASPALGTDTVLIERSGVFYTVTVDVLRSYVTTDLQSDILDISALAAATLGSTDLFLVCQVANPDNPKTISLASLETKLWTDFATYAGALSAAAAGADADKLYVLQSGVPKYLTLTLLADYVAAEFVASNSLTADILGAFDTYVTALGAVTTCVSTDVFYCIQGGAEKQVTLATIMSYVANQIALQPWTEVSPSYYDTTPESTSTIAMNVTTDFEIGYPVKYAYDGTMHYGIVTGVSAGALLTIAGAPLDVAKTISALYVGRPECVVVKHFFADTSFGNAAQDIGADVTYERHRWEMSDAYLVTFSATAGYVDTGANQPKVNVKIGTNLVSTYDINRGVELSSTAGIWTANDAVSISTTAYDITRGDKYDVRCTEAGTNGDAECLAVELTFVLE